MEGRLLEHRRAADPAQHRPRRSGDRREGDDDAFLFSEEPDFATPWRPDVCTNRFGRLRATLDLESVRLHDLRHFTATELGQSGTPVATISARLGHRDKATTLNIYSHTLPATDALAAETISRLLGDPTRRHAT